VGSESGIPLYSPGMTEPAPVQQLRAALGRLSGVGDLSSGISSLHGIRDEELSGFMVADWPLGALRRTQGGLPQESLAEFSFTIAPTKAGWLSLEFLAWFFKDQARGGESVQLRPVALPPESDEGPQLGRTLRFKIDLFWEKSGDDLGPILTRIEAIAGALDQAIDRYRQTLQA